MTTKITAGRMTSDDCDTVAALQEGGRWTVTGRTGDYDYNQALTAMALAEEYAAGATAADPIVQGWEDELVNPQEDAPDPNDWWEKATRSARQQQDDVLGMETMLSPLLPKEDDPC